MPEAAKQTADLALVNSAPPGTALAEDTNRLIDVIARAANDPTVDVDKLERLMALYERTSAQNARAAYTTALIALQQDLPIITERGGITNKDGKVQSKYALWEDINQAILPHLLKHGFSLSFRTGHEGDKITVTGVLSHREGHSEQTTMFLPADATGSKNAVQAVGSSTSYGKRYTAAALLNLTSRGEDDDGKAAGNDPITAEQLGELRALIDEAGADVEKFCAHMEVEGLKDIPKGKYDKAVAALKNKKQRQGARA